MQKRNVKILAGFLTAAIVFSGMNMTAFAKEGSGLPSAGIDFFLSNDGTSVKNLQNETGNTAGEKVIEETVIATTTKTIPEKEREYTMRFYLTGITAMVMEWIKNDCRESDEDMCRIIVRCVDGRNM